MSDDIPNVTGEGTYGCVHYPPLYCKNSKKRDLDNISKIMTTYDAKKEMKEYVLIENIDRAKQFYLGKPSKCKVGYVESNVEAIEKCKMGDDVLDNYDDYSLLIMKNGGENLKQFATKMHNMGKNDQNKRKMENFWIECHRLFNGICRFLENDIIHHDLKPQNIVFNEEKFRLNFIDFGLMQKKSKVKSILNNKGEYWLTNFHWSYPLEIGFLNKSLFRNIGAMSKQEKKQLAHAIIKIEQNYKLFEGKRSFQVKIAKAHSIFLDQCFPNSIRKFQNKRHGDISYLHMDYTLLIEEFLDSFMNIDLKYTELMEKSLNTVDVYGLGISMLHVLDQTYGFIDKDFASDLGDLFYLMVHPNINIRVLPNQALNMFEGCLKKHVLGKYKKEIIDNVIKPATKETISLKKEINDTLSASSLSNFFRKENKNVAVSMKKECPIGKEYNPITKRCNKKCKDGFIRDTQFKCKKTIKKRCPNGKVRNPKTRRCIKKCKENYKRNKDFKCVKKDK